MSLASYSTGRAQVPLTQLALMLRGPRLGGLVVGADTNARRPVRRPQGRVHPCSDCLLEAAVVVSRGRQPGRINGSAGRRLWRRDL